MKYKVGDKVRIRKTCPAQKGFGDGVQTSRYAGRVCIITAVDPHCPFDLCYQTDIEGIRPDSFMWGCEHCFEPLDPPKEETVRWEDCVWQPRHSHAS